MLVLPSTLPSVATLKADIKSNPVRWGVIFVALLVMIDALSVAAWMRFPAAKIQKTSFAAGSSAAETLSPDLSQLVDKLRAAGADPLPLSGSRIKRPPFSVPATLVAFEKDNIEVFEYSSAAEASREAQNFLSSNTENATVSKDDASWKLSASLYVQNSLLVLYVGNNEKTVSLLTGALGQPLASSLALR